jgi:hypothetical protein
VLHCHVRRGLTTAFEAAQADRFSSTEDLQGALAEDFAGQVDYLRDHRDGADFCSVTQKLQVYADIQSYLDNLAAAGISVCYARRDTNFLGTNWVNKTPSPFSLIYMIAFKKGKELKRFVVPRRRSS